MSATDRSHYKSVTTLSWRPQPKGRIAPDAPGLAGFDRETRDDYAKAIGLYLLAVIDRDEERAIQLEEMLFPELDALGLDMGELVSIYGDPTDPETSPTIKRRIENYVAVGGDGRTISRGDKVLIVDTSIAVYGHEATLSNKQLAHTLGWVTVSIHPGHRAMQYGGVSCYPSTSLQRIDPKKIAVPDWASPQEIGEEATEAEIAAAEAAAEAAAATPEIIVPDAPDEDDILSLYPKWKPEFTETEAAAPDWLSESSAPSSDVPAWMTHVEADEHEAEDEDESRDGNDLSARPDSDDDASVDGSDDVAPWDAYTSEPPATTDDAEDRPVYDFSAYRKDSVPLYAPHGTRQTVEIVESDDPDESGPLPSWLND